MDGTFANQAQKRQKIAAGSDRQKTAG